MSVTDFQNALGLERVIPLRHSIAFQCNLVHKQTILSPASCSKKHRLVPFVFAQFWLFLKVAFYRLYDKYRAVNLESLHLDTLSNTEISKPGII